MHWSFSIADVLYSGHLVMADTICSDWDNNGQTPIEKPVFSGQPIANTHCSVHVFLRLGLKISLSIMDISKIYLKQ